MLRHESSSLATSKARPHATIPPGRLIECGESPSSITSGHPRFGVAEFALQPADLVTEVRRIVDVLGPPPLDTVDAPSVAARLS